MRLFNNGSQKTSKYCMITFLIFPHFDVICYLGSFKQWQPEVRHSALTLQHSCCWRVLLLREDLPANVIEIYYLNKNAKSSYLVTVRRSKTRQLSCWRNCNSKSGKIEFQNATFLRKKWVFHFAQAVLYSSTWTKNTTTGLLQMVQGKAWDTVVC